jgi:DNA-binding transcriptional MerR regulator
VSAGLRAGQVASAAGVNLQTLRYYERRGLLDEPDRTLGGHRVYPEQAVTLLRVIKTAQRLGFSLNEVAELLESGRHHNGRRDAGLQHKAKAKIAEIDRKTADLTVIRNSLGQAVDAGCDDLMTCAGSSCYPLPFTRTDHHPPGIRLMPRPDDHPPATAGPTTSKALAVIAGFACLACCLIPVLLTAGVIGGTAWITLGQWMPTTVLVLAAAGAGMFWVTARRRRPRGCGTYCRCAQLATTAA